MHHMKLGLLRGGLIGTVLVALAGAASAADRAPSILAWSPKPVPLTAWVAPNRPHWKLSEILAKHAGQKAWTENLVEDRDFSAKYIQMAPGQKTEPRFYADSRIFWVVQDGQIRFHIQGQPDFVASKGFLVQVPFRIPYSMETVGDKPALRFEVIQSGATPLYPIDQTPPSTPGKHYIKVRFSGQGAYDAVNHPYLDFEKDVVAANGKGGPFVKDDKTFANIIRGHGAPPPPTTDFGHFHVDYSEFWFVLEGKVDYLLEGQKLFTADEGDVVYAPQGRWHRASFGGTGMATRLAINPRPEGLHNYQPVIGGQ
jgi:mannose-6-phosphate isomerase-like protein (cupin superfamily)